eukprot:6433504-Amphidinium_carterae.1
MGNRVAFTTTNVTLPNQLGAANAALPPRDGDVSLKCAYASAFLPASCQSMAEVSMPLSQLAWNASGGASVSRLQCHITRKNQCPVAYRT